MTIYHLNEKYKKQLIPYQITHTENIIRIIHLNRAVLDASDTGTGKTYAAIAACAQMKLNPIIICPKTVMATWYSVCTTFHVQPFFIVNYETIRALKYYNPITKRRIKCPHLKYHKPTDETPEFYTWHFPSSLIPNLIFIFDEAHKCSDLNTQNSKILIAAKETKIPIMLLSATIIDKPDKFKPFFYILNFISQQTVEANNIQFHDYMRLVEQWINRDAKPMVRIHNMLYPNRATRMSIDVLGDLFPSNQTIAQPYTMGRKKELEIEQEYKTISASLDALKNKKEQDKQNKQNKSNPLVAILRARQKIELLKIPTFIELANEHVAQGLSVVIFVNFTDTLKTLSKLLFTKCLIHGSQTDDERQKNIIDFQTNRESIIICNTKCGGTGISLHDTIGGHPRISLISPSFSSIDLIQVLGRIHRAGAKTVSRQRIIFCANTIEEKIADKLKKKLKDINNINNGDLDLTDIIYNNKAEEASV